MIDIVTSSWFTKLPRGHVRVGISRGRPDRIEARMYRKLAPGPWFRSVSAAEYEQRYFDEVLDKLDPGQVVGDLAALTEGGVAVLVCYEAPPPARKWCHRSLVSVWLHQTLGLAVPELGFDGFGWRHPLALAEVTGEAEEGDGSA